MWRRDEATGELFHVEPDPNDYRTPPRGLRGRLRLSGISDVFEMPNKFSDEPGAMQKKVRVEWEVVKASGKHKEHEGVRFTDLYTMSIHQRSNLGKLLGTLRRREIQPGETVDIDSFIGSSFVALIRTSDDGLYAGISPEAIEPDSIQLYGNGAKEPAPVGAGSDDGAAIFEGDDDL